jgi:DNA polymerase elongation subunit (family B)
MTNEELVQKKERIKELKKIIEEKKKSFDYNKAMQLALKLLINGTYGAFANKHFVCSNADIANAITAHGRDVIQYMLNKIEKYFYDDWHNDKETHKLLELEYIGVKDNKYCFYDINFNQVGYQFEKLKDLLDTRKINIKKIKKIDNIKNDKDINIMYEYYVHDFSDVKPIDPKPQYTKDGDPDYEGFVAYKGKTPVVIYGDTDSLYISYAPIMKSIDYHGDELQFILHMDNVFVKKMFTKFLEEYASSYGVKNLHDFELETINKSALFIEKKNYLNNVVWEDGVFHEDLSYFYPKGIEIVKSSTPAFVRERIYDVINYMFANPDNITQQKIQGILEKLKKDFEWKAYDDIDSIAMTTSCSNYDDRVIDDIGGVVVKSGAHFGVKAAAFHNYILNKNSEYKTKYDTIKSGRIKYYYCKHHVNDVFGYTRSFHPKELVEKENIIMDIDTQFEKTVLTIVNRFLKPLGLSPIKKDLGFFVSLFTFDDDE